MVEADQEGAGGQQPEGVEAFAGRGLIRYSGVGAQDHPARLALKLPAVAAEGLEWDRGVAQEVEADDHHSGLSHAGTPATAGP